ncbi:hypothetical protein AX17_006178 [Amanita inopinata Kibby_2008]|nr:hypothetical protein AX17_006178 [Amanita inopinata Kibby_2008]
METDDEVELAEELGPVGLAVGEELSSGEVLQVLVVSENLNRITRAFQIVVPLFKHFMDRKELFVTGIIVELSQSEGVGVEHNGVEVAIIAVDGEYCSKSIIRCIGFNSDFGVGYPVGEYQSRGEGLLESFKGGSTCGVKVPWDIFVG